MRLIDADAIPKSAIAFSTDGRFYVAWSEIAKAPTIEAEPVVHGRWVETLVPDGYVQKASRVRKQCSVCGWTNACRYNYCPNCGAKMDRERKCDG